MTADQAGDATAETVAAVLAEHDYAINDFGSAARRDGKYLRAGVEDPGWHGCRCNEWAGYWCDYRAHVAAAVIAARAASTQPAEAPSGDYLATVQDLQRWKREALEVLAGWERVWEALGRPGELGESKHEAALSMLTTQPAEVANGECRCQVVGVTRDPYEPHIPAQYEWEQADGCPVHPLPTPPAEHRRGDDCPQPAEPAATGAVEALADRWADVLAECKESDPRWILDQGVTALDTALRELRTALRVDRAAVAASQPTAAHRDEGAQ